MDNSTMIEMLEKQNADIEKITNALSEQIVTIGAIRNSNKRLIAELKGKSYIDINEVDYDPLNELVTNKFIKYEDKNDPNIKGLLTWINNDIKGRLNRREFNHVVMNVVTADKNGKVNNKIPYFMTSLKREIENKATK